MARGSTWGSDGRRALLASVLPALVAGCGIQLRGCGDASLLPIVDVQIVNAVEKDLETQRVTDDDLKPAIRKMMADWPDFAFRQARPQEIGWQLSVRLEQLTERPDGDGVVRSVGFSLELRALGDVEGEQAAYAAQQVLTRPDRSGRPLRPLAQDALRATGERLMRYRAIQRGPEQNVMAALDDPTEAVRLVAAQTAGERKIRAAIPKLIERLKSPDEAGAVVVSAVGALVALDAKEATGAIIDTARRQGRDYLVPLLFALARLGGKQAEAYLFTVQSGHRDPVVKQAAAQALSELEAGRSAPLADP